MKKEKIIIVGAGPGGLSAGMLLAHRGFDVEIFEKESIPGGRNGFIQLGEYKFDIGPTFFMMDFVLKEIFKETGRDVNDYLNFTRLSPMYRLHFEDKQIDIYEETEKMKAELKKNFPGEQGGLDLFNKKEAKRLKYLYPILAHHNNNILDIFSLDFIKSIPSFSIGKTIYKVLGDYFKQEKARLCFTFQSKYLGMSPWECPGAFAMVPYVEHSSGVFHVEGGLSTISEKMAKIIQEDGGKINYNKKVREIITEKGKAKGIVLDSGEKIMADKVIINADFAYSMNNLFTPKKLKKYSPSNLAKKKYSCSIFMLYLGIKKTFDLQHNTIVFAKDYKNNVSEIFGGKFTEKDFSFYVRDASRTDPTLAPQGKTALYVLVPVPNSQISKINWKETSKTLRESILISLEKRLCLNGIKENIEAEKIITPTDWEKDFNVQYGAVFNLGHQLNQMLWFRPHNKFEEIDSIYLVGGGTHPGSGLPTIYESGRIVANLISK